jgi:hypothetical protein
VAVLVVASGMRRAPETPHPVHEQASRNEEGAAGEQEPPTTQASASAA